MSRSEARQGLYQRAKARRAARVAQQQRTTRGRVYASSRAGYSMVPRTGGALVSGKENKYFDTVRSITVPIQSDWTGTEADPATFNTLFVPVVGAGLNQRIGRWVYVKKIKIRGLISMNAQADQTAADAYSVVRLTVVQDKQTNGAQAQGEDIFDDASTTSYIHAFQNTDNFGRFKVLKDKFIKFGNQNITYDGTNIEQSGDVRNFNISIKFRKPVKVNFNATNGGTIADIVDNSFHVYVNSATSGTAVANAMTYKARVVYCE